MHVTYTPAEGGKQEWTFDPDEVFEDEAEALEKVADCSWFEWVRELRKGNARVRRSLLWHLQRRAHPGLKFVDLPRSRRGELLVEFSVRELQVFREEFAANQRLTDEERDALVADCDAEIEKARAKFGDPEGKAPSPGGDEPTSSSSPRSSESDPGNFDF